MILSKQKCCLLLNGVSTESQKLTSVRQIRQDFSLTSKNEKVLRGIRDEKSSKDMASSRSLVALRNMTRIHVGLTCTLRYVKLLLSSWKIYMCNLMAWFTDKEW